MQVLAGLRVVPGAFPLPDVLPHGPVGLVPLVHRGAPGRVEQLSPVTPGEQRERDRRGGRPVRGHAEFADRPAERVGQRSEAGHARGAALVGAGADGGEPLDVLGRAHAAVDGPAQVGQGRVAVRVDEDPLGIAPDAPHGRRRRPASGRVVFPGDRGGQVVDAVGGADAADAVHCGARHERGDLVGPDRTATDLAVQVHVGVPAAGHGEEIALERLVADVDGAQDALGVTVGAGHDRPGPERHLALPQRVDERAGAVRAGVQDGGDLDPGVQQRDGGLERAVVRAEDHRTPAGPHAVPPDVAGGRPGEHDAGPVVVGEEDRPLERAGGQDEPAGPDVPEPLPGHVRRHRSAEMVGPPLHGDIEPVVVRAGHGGAGEHPYLRELGEVVGDGIADRAAAGQQDPRTGLRLGERGGQPGRTGADHEHVDVRPGLVVAGLDRRVDQLPLAGQRPRGEPVVDLERRRADHRFTVAAVDLDERVRLARAQVDHAARPAGVRAARHDAHLVAQQRRRERVAGLRGELLAVEGESHG